MKQEKIEPKGESHEFDQFGYEILDSGFDLMSSGDNSGETIQKLIRELGKHYKMGAVAVRVKTNKPRTLRYLYEYLDEKSNLPRRKDLEWQYTEKEWKTFQDHFKEGVYVYQKSGERKYDTPSIENAECEFQTFIEIPLVYQNGIFGCIDYISFGRELDLSEQQMNTLKTFAKIISIYLVNEDNHMQETHKIRDFSEYDPLTGLMKYELFGERLAGYMKDGLGEKKIAILYSDLKHFKYINETYGYDIGNKLLKRFCELNSKDVKRLIGAARVYSDNIVTALEYEPGISDEEIYEDICAMNHDMSKTLQESFMDNNICICAGVFLIKRSGIDIEMAISNANMARKEAKKQDKNHVVLFDNEMMEAVVRQMQLNAELPEALRTGEIKVYYQPKIESGTGKIVGGEALVRWQKADGSFIYPDQFVPGFEENGMIVEIDYYVYDQVFKMIQRRLAQGKPLVPVSMNISRVHLNDDEFIEYIKYLFEKYKVPSEYIEFELTESIYIENLERALILIRELRKMGIRISMDDFGSGYSSLNVLNNLPIDILKLDKVFLHGQSTDLSVSQKIIISSVVEMATRLNIRVVCEGVETAQQVQFLTIIGCDMIQGYYFAKPMPEQDFEVYIDAHSKVQAKVISFTFDGDLYDTSKKYKGDYITVGKRKEEYVDGPFKNSKALLFKGDEVGTGIVELPTEVLKSNSYTITCWAKVSDKTMWSSIVYLKFEQGFVSLMPNAADFRADYRVKFEDEIDIWHDTGSTAAADDNWHFYAISYNAQTKVGVLYIDYKIVGYLESIHMMTVLDRIIIGGDIFAKTFNGAMASLNFYNQALSRTDVISAFRKEEELMTEDVRTEKHGIERIFT